MANKKINSFTDLVAWKEGHALVLMVYELTKSFPLEERFGLIDQLKRAVVSITSNIAEGFSRNSSKEKILFFNRSLSSLTEVQNQILIGRDLGYTPKDAFRKVAHQTIFVNKLICGLIKSAESMSH